MIGTAARLAAGLAIALAAAGAGLIPTATVGQQGVRGKAEAAEQPDAEVPAYTLKVLADGRSLSVAGGIRFGLERDIAAELKADPRIRTIYLTSPGGRLGAAEQVAGLIKQRGLDTYVPNECSSACTRIFVAGKHRTLLNGARLGFHSAAFTAPVPAPGLLVWAANQITIGLYAAAGVDRDFMQHAVSVSSGSIWYPSAGELLAAHVITRVTDGQGFSVSGWEAAKWYGKDAEHGYPASQRVLEVSHGPVTP